MKKIIGVDIGGYVFDASARTVTVTGLQGPINLEQFLLITNVTDGIIIYNFAASTGTLAGNVLTLAYDTSTMSDTDRLQIIVDLDESEIASSPANVADAPVLNELRNKANLTDTQPVSLASIPLASGAALATHQETLLYLIETLQELCRSMASLASAKGIAGDIRVTPLTTPNMATLSNISNIGGHPTSGFIEDIANISAQNNINNVIG